MVVWGGVHDVTVPLAMGRHFGHDEGRSIVFFVTVVSVVAGCSVV